MQHITSTIQKITCWLTYSLLVGLVVLSSSASDAFAQRFVIELVDENGDSALSVKDAFILDSKFDDGNPETGLIRVESGGCLTDGEYDTTQEDNLCTLSFSVEEFTDIQAAVANQVQQTCSGNFPTGTTRIMREERNGHKPICPFGFRGHKFETCMLVEGDAEWRYTHQTCEIIKCDGGFYPGAERWTACPLADDVDDGYEPLELDDNGVPTTGYYEEECMLGGIWEVKEENCPKKSDCTSDQEDDLITRTVPCDRGQGFSIGADLAVCRNGTWVDVMDYDGLFDENGDEIFDYDNDSDDYHPFEEYRDDDGDNPYEKNCRYVNCGEPPITPCTIFGDDTDITSGNADSKAKPGVLCYVENKGDNDDACGDGYLRSPSFVAFACGQDGRWRTVQRTCIPEDEDLVSDDCTDDELGDKTVLACPPGQWGPVGRTLRCSVFSEVNDEGDLEDRYFWKEVRNDCAPLSCGGQPVGTYRDGPECDYPEVGRYIETCTEIETDTDDHGNPIFEAVWSLSSSGCARIQCPGIDNSETGGSHGDAIWPPSYASLSGERVTALRCAPGYEEGDSGDLPTRRCYADGELHGEWGSVSDECEEE